jgi:hypothetical protein
LIYNPRSGQLEQHLVTISDASLAEWVRDRESLTAQGYPDRPPTYDDPKIRTWANWGDMPGDPPSSIPADRAGERFAQSWTVRHPVLGCDLKMLAFEMPRDGDFLLRHKSVTASGDVRELEQRFSTWRDLLLLVEICLGWWSDAGCPEPSVFTSVEMAALADLLDGQGQQDGVSAAA